MNRRATQETKDAIRQYVYGRNGPGNVAVALRKVEELASAPGLTHQRFKTFLAELSQPAAHALLKGLKKAFGNRQAVLESIAKGVVQNAA